MRNAKLLKYFEENNCSLFLKDDKLAIPKGAKLTNDMRSVIHNNREVIIQDIKEQTQTTKRLFASIDECKNWSDLEMLLEKYHIPDLPRPSYSL